MVSNGFFHWCFLILTCVDVTLEASTLHCYIGFSSSVSFVFLGAEQIRSLNTRSCALRMPISIKKYCQQQVASRLFASRFIVYCGTNKRFEMVYPIKHVIGCFCTSRWFVIHPPPVLIDVTTIFLYRSYW